jgi:hypothetical protein
LRSRLAPRANQAWIDVKAQIGFIFEDEFSRRLVNGCTVCRASTWARFAAACTTTLPTHPLLGTL